MTQVNADIILKKSTVSGEVPSAADLEVAEVAINTADGKLFTKHTDDSIKEISGKVSSVNGEVGDVSLGIQDMDDFELYPDLSGIATIQYDRSVSYGLTGGASPIRNGGIDGLAINVTSYDGQNSDTFWSGHPSNGTFWWSTDGGTTWSETSGSYTGYISQRWLGSVALHNSPSNAILTLTRDDPNTIPDTPLADGDHLQWVDADQAFKPVQLAAVATSGSYNDLTDLPPAAAVDSVNGETGAVSLGVQDMDDFALLLSEGSTWNYSSDNSDNADVGNTGVNDGKVTGKESGVSYQLYTLFFGDIDDAGLNRRADMLQAVTDGAVVSVFYDGVLAFSDVVTSPGGSANDFGRVALSFAGGNFFFPPSVGTTVGLALPGSPALPLAAGDMLKWDAAEQAFRPTQLATVATSGSYNDLSDQPVIPTVPVDSVNGETGAVSLGIQEMDDFELNTEPAPSFAWDYGDNNTAGFASGGTIPQAALFVNRTDKDGKTFDDQAINATGTIYASLDATNWISTTYTVRGDFTNATRVCLETNAHTLIGFGSTGEVIYISIGNDPGQPVDVDLAEGDILQWVDADQKFKPAQLATVATSGSYNDLTDQPTIPAAAPVDSVNGETGAVSLGIQEMDDYGLSKDTSTFTAYTLSGTSSPTSMVNGTFHYNGYWLYITRVDANGEAIPQPSTATPLYWREQGTTTWNAVSLNTSVDVNVGSGNTLPGWGMNNGGAGGFPSNGLTIELAFQDFEQLPDIPLVEGDTLTWNAADSKFKPTQMVDRIQDQTDYQPDPIEEAAFSSPNQAYTVDGAYNLASGSGFYYIRLALKDDNGNAVDFASMPSAGTLYLSQVQGGPYTAISYIDSIDYTGFDYWEFKFDTDTGVSNALPLYLGFNEEPGGAAAPKNGDTLQWSEANQAFMPVQLATVATSGDYNDLANKPTIPPEVEPGISRIQDADDFAYNKVSPVAYRYNATPTDSGPGGAWIRTDLDDYVIYLHEETADGVNIAAELATKRTEAPSSIWFSADGVNGWAEFPYTSTKDTGTGGVLTYFQADGRTAPLPTTGADVYFSLSDPAQQVDVPLADGDVLKWVDVDQEFKPAQLATVATSGSYNDLADQPTIPTAIDDLSDVDTATTAPTDGQVLTWVNANSQWEPGDLQGASIRAALGIGEYADDAAAGTGGVASGAMYYNTTSSDYRLKS